MLFCVLAVEHRASPDSVVNTMLLGVFCKQLSTLHFLSVWPVLSTHGVDERSNRVTVQ